MWGGLLDRPGVGVTAGTSQLDPRARGYGAQTGTAAAPGARQGSSPYSASPPAAIGGGSVQVSHVLVGLVLAEMFALVALRRLFRNYHGG